MLMIRPGSNLQSSVLQIQLFFMYERDALELFQRLTFTEFIQNTEPSTR